MFAVLMKYNFRKTSKYKLITIFQVDRYQKPQNINSDGTNAEMHQ